MVKHLLVDLQESKQILEDIIGIPVIYFRVPSFSISANQMKIIKKAGCKYDSSTTDALRFYGGLIAPKNDNIPGLQSITFKGVKNFWKRFNNFR